MFTNDKTTQALAEKYLQMLESIKEKKKEASVEVEADDEAKTEVDVKSSGDSARNDDPAAKKTPGKEKKADKDDKKEKEMDEAKLCEECGKSPCACDEEMDEGKMDAVGKEDDDVDNDGDVDSSDKYLKKRRAAISKSMKEGYSARALAREEYLRTRIMEAAGDRKFTEKDLEMFAARLGMSVADVKKYLDETEFSMAGDFKESVDLEEEQLDELSKATLGSYIKKASDDQADSGYERGRNSADSDRSKKAIDKYIKRRSGINKAVKRLTKEEDELDEAILSKDDFMAGRIDVKKDSDEKLLAFLKAPAKKGPGSNNMRKLVRDELKRRGVKV